MGKLYSHTIVIFFLRSFYIIIKMLVNAALML